MIIFEILFDLFTAIPFLFFMAFMFNLLLYWRNPKYRRKLKWSCLAFGIISLLFTNYHYNALFKSGPLRGQVTDLTTGMPIEGVEVVAVWSGGSQPPITLPGWAYLIRYFVEFKCNVSSQTMVTDAYGKFSSNYWYGAKVWHGCGDGIYRTSAPGYQFTHYNIQNTMVGYRVSSFDSVHIQLSPESIDGQRKGY